MILCFPCLIYFPIVSSGPRINSFLRCWRKCARDYSKRFAAGQECPFTSFVSCFFFESVSRFLSRCFKQVHVASSSSLRNVNRWEFMAQRSPSRVARLSAFQFSVVGLYGTQQMIQSAEWWWLCCLLERHWIWIIHQCSQFVSWELRSVLRCWDYL